MKNVFVFSQNLKLKYLAKRSDLSLKDDDNFFITTQKLFENEKKEIESAFSNCFFSTFANYLSDEEMAKCDEESYFKNIDHDEYVTRIKRMKNELVVKKMLMKGNFDNRFIFSDDLGIDLKVWKKEGFKYIEGEYYYDWPKEKDSIKDFLHRFAFLRTLNRTIKRIVYHEDDYKPEYVNVAHYDDKKVVFLGRLDRIGYRLDLNFELSEEECENLNKGRYEDSDHCIYMTTWHEHDKCKVPDKKRFCVRWAQDGYLPPNYSHHDYDFKPNNVVYYCWDKIGSLLFKNQDLPFEMIPFRKKIYLPEPVFPEQIKNILIVASGSGDWTALKNRSDDDLLVEAFAKMAEKFPEIQFTYRCHPTWVHPEHVGVNSIGRVSDYFESLSLPNLRVSSNIPQANKGNEFVLSFSRSSLEEDLAKADLVFGEHSISMIDAAFKKIPFSSVNLTNRRNLFVGISDLGFPHCNSISEIEKVIRNVSDQSFKADYLRAVDNYNKMTDEDF